MEYKVLAWIGIALFVYSISVRQLQRAELTGPMWFVLIGIGISIGFGQSTSITQLDRQVWQPLIELTLAIFLFSDAAKTRLRVLIESAQLPARLLFIGLPLTIALATLLACVLLGFSWIAAVLLAIIIAPTDAALCRGFITAKQVPANLREAINVESGLNDGLCVPLFLLAIGFLTNPAALTSGELVVVFIREVGVGILVAIAMTSLAIFLLHQAKTHHLFAKNTSPYLFVGFCIAVYAITQSLHGSGFIAAFVSGLLFDKFYHDAFKDKLIADGETIAELAAMMIWVLFGFIALTTVLHANVYSVIYAFAAVTILRVIPVLMALIKSNTTWQARLTLAWFGPRGMASVVFTLMLLDISHPDINAIAEVAVITILLSVFLHGITTRPISLSFSKKH